MKNITEKKRKITVPEYQALRKTTEWDMLDDEVIKEALKIIFFQWLSQKTISQLVWAGSSVMVLSFFIFRIS